MNRDDDFMEAAEEELDRAMTLGWAALAKLTPWGDTFEGFTPEGREVSFDRSYLWEGDAGGDILVEVVVYEPRAYEDGVRVTRGVPREPPTGDGSTV